MSVRGKFKVDSIVMIKDGGSVFLTPVVSGSTENEQFYKWTPSGKIELSTINKDVLGQFIPGGEYYVDFTKASETEEGK